MRSRLTDWAMIMIMIAIVLLVLAAFRVGYTQGISDCQSIYR